MQPRTVLRWLVPFALLLLWPVRPADPGPPAAPPGPVRVAEIVREVELGFYRVGEGAAPPAWWRDRRRVWERELAAAEALGSGDVAGAARSLIGACTRRLEGRPPPADPFEVDAALEQARAGR